MATSRLQDPFPAFERLSEEVGLPVGDLTHHALVRWVAAGSEALMTIEPRVLQDLIDARERKDWVAVAGIIDWLRAGT